MPTKKSKVEKPKPPSMNVGRLSLMNKQDYLAWAIPTIIVGGLQAASSAGARLNAKELVSEAYEIAVEAWNKALAEPLDL